MNTAKSIFQFALPMGLLTVSTLLVPTPASAITVSGFTGIPALPSQKSCLLAQNLEADNRCTTGVQVHYDIQNSNGPFDTFVADVNAPAGTKVTCWAESWSADGTKYDGGALATDNGSGLRSLYLGQIYIFDTHNVVCNMDPGTTVYSVAG